LTTEVTSTATDTSNEVRAQDDLFRHVNGAWMAATQIPEDRASFGAFEELRDDAERAVREIVETAAQASTQGAGVTGSTQLIGDLYRSFMDTDAVEAGWAEPLAYALRDVAGLDTVEAFANAVGRYERAGAGGMFGVYVDTDPGQPDRYTVNLAQGGLGLPDESYYREEQYAEIRTAYVQHLSRLLALAGLADAAEAAAKVMALETDLAGAHWDNVKSRDRSLTYNPMDASAREALLPAPVWAAWLDGLQASPAVLEHTIVSQPSFFSGLTTLLSDERLPDWRAWLSANVVHAAAPYSGTDLVEENFDFYGRTLSGTPQLRERWKRGVSLVEGAVGEAVGELYVAQHFPPQAKERMDDLVDNLLRAYHQEINNLPWMSAETKLRALDKLAAFTPKIGYPARWRDYSHLVIRADDLIGNVARASAFELDRELAKIGAPVDRDEWFMTPQTVNAYYNPGMNEIVFPAAILRPPFFDFEADDAVNYGGIGAVIGHEIGHGFDDQGSKYDGSGALDDWWTEADRTAFDALTSKLKTQYSALAPAQVPDHHVNGDLTIGENIGDLGGLGIAYVAWRLSLANGDPGNKHNNEDNPEPDPAAAQRLFASWATVWRTKGRDAEVLRRLAIDPHAPPEFRCNQVVRNLDEFYTAFGVIKDDALWLDAADRVRIW
jgi:putative endopeptidase